MKHHLLIITRNSCAIMKATRRTAAKFSRASSRCSNGSRILGIKAGVCTNKPEGLSRLLLDTLALSRFLGTIVGPDTIGIAKPQCGAFS